MKKSFEPFGRDSMTWKINRERIVLLGGPAAAVLQVAHPQVAMGVSAHSKFRTDTMGRLHRTLEAVYTIAFGSAEEVEQVKAGVARAHHAVKGEGYSAFDPGAQLWVLATLIMGSATMYRRFVGPLTEQELERFLVENQRFGEVFGLDPGLVPKSWDAFENYFETMLNGPLLGSHPLCPEVANAVIMPDSPWFMKGLSPVLRAMTVEYLPLQLQQKLKIRSGSLSKIFWPALDRILPTLMKLSPPVVRYAPHYRRALLLRNNLP
jgi:uncharacterized protein (DUF2236 family)